MWKNNNIYKTNQYVPAENNASASVNAIVVSTMGVSSRFAWKKQKIVNVAITFLITYVKKINVTFKLKAKKLYIFKVSLKNGNFVNMLDFEGI